MWFSAYNLNEFLKTISCASPKFETDDDEMIETDDDAETDDDDEGGQEKKKKNWLNMRKKTDCVGVCGINYCVSIFILMFKTL